MREGPVVSAIHVTVDPAARVWGGATSARGADRPDGRRHRPGLAATGRCARGRPSSARALRAASVCAASPAR